tara:strand:- start:473 stop:694 length:222 start_codon:yes stop_codon:yes gene_type:complete
MKVGDLILYTPKHDYYGEGEAQVGIVLKLTPSGKKASVLWSNETVGLFFSVGDLERYPGEFTLLEQGEENESR